MSQEIKTTNPEVITKLREAAIHFSNGLQALRDANSAGAGWLLGSIICEQVQKAAELKNKVATLAEFAERDNATN